MDSGGKSAIHADDFPTSKQSELERKREREREREEEKEKKGKNMEFNCRYACVFFI